MSRAPCSAVIARSAALKPGPGGTTPMLPGLASVITAAICSPNRAKVCCTASMSL
ncbi:Uncharacterised protein [Mycobacterium tuberculosis]|nr:Uncharacterised protein [Mycobacterium tuberculosis]CKR09739.1 Uncharacterised protein [Mycobacterium tuberculosis]